jgi:hypothetical protein
MKFYIASGLENYLKAQHLMELAKHFGHEITYDWTQVGSLGDAGDAAYQAHLAREISGIETADVVIVLLPGGRSTHCELAWALASKKRVFVAGDADDGWGRRSVWYHHPNVERRLGSAESPDLVDLMKELAAA